MLVSVAHTSYYVCVLSSVYILSFSMSPWLCLWLSDSWSVGLSASLLRLSLLSFPRLATLRDINEDSVSVLFTWAMQVFSARRAAGEKRESQ